MNFQIACSETIDINDLTLFIESPEEIIEANVFTVTILANGTPVEDVTVIFGSQECIEYTDYNGKVQFTAPSLIHDSSNKNYSIIASKSDYISNEKNITIINIPNLHIKEEFKPRYKRNEIITITVIDYSYQPVGNATIEFENNIYYSDDNGKATLIMPSNSGKHELKITKEGYANYQIDIDIVVVGQPPNAGIVVIYLRCIATVIILISIIIIYLIAEALYKKKRRGK